MTVSWETHWLLDYHRYQVNIIIIVDEEQHLVCNFKQVYESKKPLRIGYYVNDGLTKATPACERAVLVAKTALEKMGHEVSFYSTLQ